MKKNGLITAALLFGLLMPVIVLAITKPNLTLSVSDNSNSPLTNFIAKEKDFLMSKSNNPVFINKSKANLINISNIINKTNFPKMKVLAKVYNENNLNFNKNYRKKYLEKNKNFSNVKFENFSRKKSFMFRIGAQNDEIKGSQIENKNFAIDLIICNSYEGYCAFRVNGIPTKQVYIPKKTARGKRNSFALDENHIMKLNSAKFNVCPNQRFCHLGYEGYHEINVGIVKRR